MRRRGGFTLIECMMYIFFLGLISVLWFSTTIRIYNTMCCAQHKNKVLLALYTAGDVFARDLRMKSPLGKEMIYRNGGIIWHYTHDLQSIGWFLLDNALMRFEGVKNKKKGTWSVCTKSILCPTLTTAKFTTQNNNAAVSMSLTAVNGVTMERTVWL